MKQNIRIKPSKPMSAAQMIVGIILALVGVSVVIPMMSKDGGPAWFGLLWTGVALIGAIIGAINAFSDKGIPTEEIVSDSINAPQMKSTEGRLRELDDLQQKKLISQDEYTETRKRILDEH